jgi:putative transposase
VLITDKLKSYEAAKKKILKGVEHIQHRGLNNRAENCHRPPRLRERRMDRQHKLTAPEYRTTMSQRFERWEE